MKTKTVFRFYPAAAFRRNARDLDRRADAGWRLEKAGAFRCVFARSDAVFRHALDYCPDTLGDEVLEKRRARFAAAGWEYVNRTATGWAFYRKPFDPGQPAAAYEPPAARPPAQEALYGPISLLFWLRALLLAAGAALAVYAVAAERPMALPALVFLALVLLLSYQIQKWQKRLR